jgi:hypothetical protein
LLELLLQENGGEELEGERKERVEKLSEFACVVGESVMAESACAFEMYAFL